MFFLAMDLLYIQSYDVQRLTMVSNTSTIGTSQRQSPALCLEHITPLLCQERQTQISEWRVKKERNIERHHA